MRRKSSLGNFVLNVSLLTALAILLADTTVARDKYETIDATAYGTNNQLGANVGITVIVYELSTPEDRQILVDSFQKGESQGVANALSKMKAVGRLQIPGTTGYDLSYIRMIPTPTGRTIQFVANRKITFGEAYSSSERPGTGGGTPGITAGEFQLNYQDKSKSTGVLYPSAEPTINKDGELKFESNENSWRLSNIIDWKGTSEN